MTMRMVLAMVTSPIRTAKPCQPGLLGEGGREGRQQQGFPSNQGRERQRQ